MCCGIGGRGTTIATNITITSTTTAGAEILTNRAAKFFIDSWKVRMCVN